MSNDTHVATRVEIKKWPCEMCFDAGVSQQVFEDFRGFARVSISSSSMLASGKLRKSAIAQSVKTILGLQEE